MILGTLQLNESHTMSFGMNVFGTAQMPTEVRFVIEGATFAIVCKCKQIGEDIEVEIPHLKGILEAGEYPVKLEVIIGDKIFTPLRESIEFDPLVELDIMKKNLKIQKEGVEITIKESSSKEIKVTPIETAIAEGFEIVEINGYSVLKKDEKYFGFVTDAKILKSPNGYATLEKLVESLSDTE